MKSTSRCPRRRRTRAASFTPDAWEQLRGRLLDIHGERLREMDAHGIEMMVLSLNSPAVQAVLDPREAAAMARRANDLLAEDVQKASRPVPGICRAADAGP